MTGTTSSTGTTARAEAPAAGESRVLRLDGARELTRAGVGGKAYSVNRMRRLGLPVPPAFVLPTIECSRFLDAGGKLDDELWCAVRTAMAELEADTGRVFGRGPAPLLVSVRSGAAESMPGMMDTVLNLGLTEELAAELGAASGDPAWADDTWRRFRRSYAEIVAGADPEDSVDPADPADPPAGPADPADPADPPADPWEQLRAAIGAVFRSWDSPRAIAYRERHRLEGIGGTAVTVQAMVFGNRDENSGTGVLFSRDPASGAPGAVGDWLARAQGEEVVAGVRTPETLDDFAEEHPGLHTELLGAARLVEDDLRDLADLEFTVESGRLYVLQSRAGKRTPTAAVRIAVDLVREGVIERSEAIGRISEEHAARLVGGTGVSGGAVELAHGTGIGTGVASGVAVSDLAEAERRAVDGESIVLVRPMTSPDDVPVMFAVAAVVTEVGGSTSHAALVCREIGVPCVVGCGSGTIDALEGRVVTVDGTGGGILAGDATAESSGDDEHLAELLEWVRAADDASHPLAPLVRGTTAGRPEPEGEQS